MVLDRFSAALKAFTQPNIVNATNASKNYTYANAGYGAAATGRNRTLQWNKYGAAGALLLSPDMASCVTEFATIANSTDLKLMQDGEVVATSTDYDSDVAIFRMLADFAERNDGRSLMYFHALHLFTTGEAYIEILRNDYGRVGGVDFLNSLNTWYTVVNGRIQSYSYAPSYGGKYATLSPDDVIYDKYPLDLFDEFKGYAPIMHILGSGTLQVMQAAGQTMLAYFENGALPGAIVSPEKSNSTGDGGVWGEREIQAITNVFARFKGARNQHGLMISPKALEAQVFDQPDLKKWSDLLQDLRPQIYGVYQIPPSQIGISDNTRFQVSPSDVSQYKRRMARMLSNLERVYNNALIPAVYGERQSVRLEFDKSAFEVVSEENLQRAETAYNLGAIPVNELRVAAGYAPDDDIGDLHYVPNVGLVPKSELRTLWQKQLMIAPSPIAQTVDAMQPAIEAPPAPALPDSVQAIVDDYKAPVDDGYKVPDKYSHIDFKPSDAMVTEAKRGLAWRDEYGRGGTEVGVARARDISNRSNLSPDTVKRMNSYFARHEVDKQGEGWNREEDGYPSAGRIAWALWGGDAGQAWASKRVEQMDAADDDASKHAKAMQADASEEYDTWRKFTGKHGKQKALRFETFHLPAGIVSDVILGLKSDKPLDSIFIHDKAVETSTIASEDAFMQLVNVWQELGFDDLLAEIESEADDDERNQDT